MIWIGRSVKLIPCVDAPFVAPLQLLKCSGIPYFPISISPEIEILILFYGRLSDYPDPVGRFSQLKMCFHSRFENQTTSLESSKSGDVDNFASKTEVTKLIESLEVAEEGGFEPPRPFRA